MAVGAWSQQRHFWRKEKVDSECRIVPMSMFTYNHNMQSYDSDNKALIVDEKTFRWPLRFSLQFQFFRGQLLPLFCKIYHDPCIFE